MVCSLWWKYKRTNEKLHIKDRLLCLNIEHTHMCIDGSRWSNNWSIINCEATRQSFRFSTTTKKQNKISFTEFYYNDFMFLLYPTNNQRLTSFYMFQQIKNYCWTLRCLQYDIVSALWMTYHPFFFSFRYFYLKLIFYFVSNEWKK